MLGCCCACLAQHDKVNENIEIGIALSHMTDLLHSSHMTSFNQSVGSNYWLVCLPLVHAVTTQNSVVLVLHNTIM